MAPATDVLGNWNLVTESSTRTDLRYGCALILASAAEAIDTHEEPRLFLGSPIVATGVRKLCGFGVLPSRMLANNDAR